MFSIMIELLKEIKIQNKVTLVFLRHNFDGKQSKSVQINCVVYNLSINHFVLKK